MNFVLDSLVDGRRVRCLNVVDDYTKKTFAIEVDMSLSGLRVARVLDQIALHRPPPPFIYTPFETARRSVYKVRCITQESL